MSVTQELLDKAQELGLDVSELETDEEVQSVIDAKEEELKAEEEAKAAEEKAKEEAKQKRSEAAKKGAAKKNQSEVAEEKDEVEFETLVPVSFNVGGKVFEGTKFSFPASVVEDRKRIVREAYGDVVKEQA